jgi:hypothetical protein
MGMEVQLNVILKRTLGIGASRNGQEMPALERVWTAQRAVKADHCVHQGMKRQAVRLGRAGGEYAESPPLAPRTSAHKACLRTVVAVPFGAIGLKLFSEWDAVLFAPSRTPYVFRQRVKIELASHGDEVVFGLIAFSYVQQTTSNSCLATSRHHCQEFVTVNYF